MLHLAPESDGGLSLRKRKQSGPWDATLFRAARASSETHLCALASFPAKEKAGEPRSQFRGSYSGEKKKTYCPRMVTLNSRGSVESSKIRLCDAGP